MLKKSKTRGANTEDPDDMAHLDLQYLQIQLLLCLALYGLTYSAAIPHCNATLHKYL